MENLCSEFSLLMNVYYIDKSQQQTITVFLVTLQPSLIKIHCFKAPLFQVRPHAVKASASNNNYTPFVAIGNERKIPVSSVHDYLN